MREKPCRMPRILLAGGMLLVVLTVSALAYLSASTGSLTNTFKPATETNPSILEGSDGNTFDGITKEQVKVNVGDSGYAVYVRAAIVVNWEEDGKEGTYHATAPVAGTDYTLTLNTSDWFKGSDGFYYHKAMVNPNGTTAKLINSCTAIASGPDVYEGETLITDYKLNVKIIAQTIQALGTTDAVDANGEPIDGTPAVTDAWGIAVDSSGNLVEPTP